MEWTSFEAWLEKYGRAWRDRNPQAAADLYTDDGTYQATPLEKPMRGRPEIFDYWSHVARTEENIQFGYEILAVTPELGIATMVGVVCHRSPETTNQARRNFSHIP
jgi:hypothetical protein